MKASVDLPRTRAAAMRPDDRRSMIIEATLPLILEHGEMATTHDIAEAAGIAEGTIFRVFDSKDALIEAVIDHSFDVESIERVIATIDASLPLEDVVTEIVTLLQERVVTVWRLMSSVGPRFHQYAQRPAVDSAQLERLFRANRASLTVSAADAARTLRSLTLALTHPMLAPSPTPPREVARRFLYGIAKCPPC